MRTILLACVSAVQFMACSGSGDRMAEVKALEADWQKAGVSIGTFQEKVANELREWKTMYAGMDISPEELTHLDDEHRAELAALRKKFASHQRTYLEINEEVADLRESWAAKHQELLKLQDELQAGNLKPNTFQHLRSLREMAQDATEKVTLWTEELKFTQADCLAAYQAFASMVSSSGLGQNQTN